MVDKWPAYDHALVFQVHSEKEVLVEFYNNRVPWGLIVIVCRCPYIAKLLGILVNTSLCVAMMAPSSAVFAAAGIEIVPVAVWQGKASHKWSVSALQSIRKSFPGMKIAHAVDAASLLRGQESEAEFRRNVSRAILPGDDVLLHVAPWKTLVEKAGVAFKTAPTVFGAPIELEMCVPDCGLELSFNAFSAVETRSIIQTSKDLLREAGFGVADAIYFDEGVINTDLRSVAHRAGVSQDWSGIELTQLNEALGRFPIYQWNRDIISGLPVNDTSVVSVNGLVLDHVRFGTHAEVGNLDGAVKRYKDAVAVAQKHARVVRVAMVFNVEDLIHTHGFISAAMVKAAFVAKEAGVPIQEWTALNTRWSADEIRGTKESADAAVAGNAVPAANPSVPPSDEPEFIPSDEMESPALEAH